MLTRKPIPQILSVLLIIISLVVGAPPAQSESLASSLNSSGSFIWAKGMGGANDDIGIDIVVDSNGSVYITGYFKGTADFDPGVGTFNLTSAGSDDIFVSKLDSSGNFVWAKSMGGTSDDYSYSVVIDVNGNVLTTGYFEGSADFDPSAGVFILNSAGSRDIFVSKLDSSGNFIWAKNMGGISTEEGSDIAVDESGNVYTTGYFLGTADFDPGSGVSNLTSAGQDDIFISKLDSNGNFIWAKSMGGTGFTEQGIGVVVDSNGNVYTTGIFRATADFDPGTGTYNLISAGDKDTFVSKLDSGGNFVWAISMGGTHDDVSSSIALDSSKNVYTTGIFQYTADFDPGINTFNLTSAGLNDIFVSKLDNSGNFVWAKRMGGAKYDGSNDITIDASGKVLTTGSFEGSVDFDPGAGAFILASAGGVLEPKDSFVSRLDSSGNFVWAQQMGGFGNNDVGLGIGVDSSGNVYTIGTFAGTADFDPSLSAFNLTSAGLKDIFVSKLENYIAATNIYLPLVLRNTP